MRAFAPYTIAATLLASLAAPALAAEPIYVSPLPRPPAVLPPLGPNPTNPGYVYVQPDGSGQFDCQLGEKRTRLEKEACGPLKNRFGD